MRTLDQSLRPYRHSAHDLAEIRRQVTALLAKGLIRKSKSPWAFPVTLATKSDSSRRLCCDYRLVNSKTVDEREPIPIVQDIIDSLASARYFSVLDMAWGYWHVPMHPDSIEKTAFITPDGHYEWLVLPFGLKNAPATFQRIVLQVLGDLVNQGVIPYFDDIIVYAPTLDEHQRILQAVLQRLKDTNIRLRYEKCKFAQTSVEYLGFVVSYGLQRPSPKNTESVTNFPIPRNAKDIQRFIGLANYYRRFVQNFSRIAEPLTRLTRKNTEFRWGPEQQISFDKLKQVLTSKPVVAIYDTNKPVILHTDASKIGIGAVLMQPDVNGHNKVVAYFSRRLNNHETNYSASELEVLAVVESVEYFHVYVHGKHINIYSDHQALQWLFNIKKPSSRLFRWSVRLSIYTYTIHHRSGKSNTVAYALSRAAIALFTDLTTLKTEQSKANTAAIRNLEDFNGLIINKFRGLKRIYVPQSLRSELFGHYHDQYGHPGIAKTSQLILSHYWWETATDDINHYIKSCRNCQLVKISSKPKLGKMNPPPTAALPMDTWAIDTIVMGSSANKTRAKYVQLIVDHHSRYVWAFATPKNTTPTIINILSQLFAAIGKPKTIITDNFESYTAKQFRSFLADRQIRHNLCSPYHPQANGICEKANDTIIRGLRLAHFDKPTLKWSTLLPTVVDNYNRTPHSATGFSPKYLHFGEVCYDSLHENISSNFHEKADENLHENLHQIFIKPDLSEARKLAVHRSDSFKSQRKQTHDERHPSSELLIGELVLRRLPDNHPSKQKLSPAHTGPFVIRQKTGPESYRISPEKDGSIIYAAHASQLTRFLPRLGSLDAGGVKCSDTLRSEFLESPSQTRP